MSPSLEPAPGEFATEIKFAITADRADAIREWARARLAPDPNGSGQAGDTYLTTSLYFDTPDLGVYFRRGSFGRAKYRVRRYCDGPMVYLERKLKSRDRVGKRRSAIGAGELERIDAAEPGERWAGRWFHRRIRARDLRPVCQVAYLRTARLAATASGPIRLTLDSDLRAAPVDRAAYRPHRDAVVIAPSACILELKYRNAMPSLFERLIAEFFLTPARASKYRMAMEALGRATVSVEAAYA